MSVVNWTARPDESVPIHSVNIVVLGDRGVGKTAVCRVRIVFNTPWSRCGPGSRERTLAVLRRKNAKK